ncbi:MAG: hypothetical protein HUU60_05715 [Armatimonadetes bacterium]|nr:hypothetical protein [Armatimonadota bacterium]
MGPNVDDRGQLFIYFARDEFDLEAAISSLAPQIGRAAPMLAHWLEHENRKVRERAKQVLLALASPEISLLVAERLDRYSAWFGTVQKPRYVVTQDSMAPQMAQNTVQASKAVSALCCDYLEVLVECGGELAQKKLYEALLSNSDQVAAKAAELIARSDLAPDATAIAAALKMRQGAPWKRVWKSVVFFGAAIGLGPTVAIGVTLAILAADADVKFPQLWWVGALVIGSILGLIALIALLTARQKWKAFEVAALNGLAMLKTPAALGPLLVCSIKPQVQKEALEALNPLLSVVDQSNAPALDEAEDRAMAELIAVGDLSLTKALLSIAPLVGGMALVKALKARLDDLDTDKREMVESALPAIEAGAVKRAEASVLLRATTEEQDAEQLLRASQPGAEQEDPNTLLRSGEG